jgi:hypothetical protein
MGNTLEREGVEQSTKEGSKEEPGFIWMGGEQTGI